MKVLVTYYTNPKKTDKSKKVEEVRLDDFTVFNTNTEISSRAMIFNQIQNAVHEQLNDTISFLEHVKVLG